MKRSNYFFNNSDRGFEYIQYIIVRQFIELAIIVIIEYITDDIISTPSTIIEHDWSTRTIRFYIIIIHPPSILITIRTGGYTVTLQVTDDGKLPDDDLTLFLVDQDQCFCWT